MADLPYPVDEGSTHWVGCYRERRHHNCAVVEVDRLRAENERLRNVLGIADAALLRGISACANLCGDDTPAPVRKLAADAVLVMRDAREALEATDDS